MNDMVLSLCSSNIVRLEGLVYAHSTFASYEPELFPGLIYRLVSPRVVFLIFVSGKIVITGAKTETELAQAYAKMYPVLVEYRKLSTLSTIPLGITTPAITGPTTQSTTVAPSRAPQNDHRTVEEV